MNISLDTPGSSLMVVQVPIHVVGVKHLVLYHRLARLAEHVLVHLHLLDLIDGVVHSFILVRSRLPWLIRHSRLEPLHL